MYPDERMNRFGGVATGEMSDKLGCICFFFVNFVPLVDKNFVPIRG